MSIIKSIGIVVLHTVLFVNGFQIAHAADVFGNWNVPGELTIIHIYECSSSTICGVITVPPKDGVRDIKNPKPSLRSRTIAGLTLFKLFKSGDQKWEGSLYNPRDGKTYKGKLVLQEDNKLKLSGCIFGGMICQGDVWQRK